jgi:predicted porin
MFTRLKRIAAVGALVSAFALAFAITTFAADLGGACCSDLEERVAELEATAARKGNRKVSVTVYGTVNYGIVSTSINTSPFPQTAVATPSHDPTRLGFAGSAKALDGITAGFTMEFQLSSSAVASAAGNVLGDPWVQTRKASVYVEHKVFGRVTLGKDSQATDGITEISVANTRIASPMLRLSPLEYYTVGIEPTGISGTKTELIRYDSAAFAGFIVSGSRAGDKTYDIAVKYAGEVQGFQIAAGAGFRDQGDGLSLLPLTAPETKWYLASASVKHLASGLFVNGAVSAFKGVTVLQGTDQSAWAVQGGMEKNVLGMGATTGFFEYQQLSRDSADAIKFWGVGAVQSIDAAALDLYASVRFYDAGSLGTKTDQVGTIGARIRF